MNLLLRSLAFILRAVGSQGMYSGRGRHDGTFVESWKALGERGTQ